MKLGWRSSLCLLWLYKDSKLGPFLISPSSLPGSFPTIFSPNSAYILSVNTPLFILKKVPHLIAHSSRHNKFLYLVVTKLLLWNICIVTGAIGSCNNIEYLLLMWNRTYLRNWRKVSKNKDENQLLVEQIIRYWMLRMAILSFRSDKYYTTWLTKTYYI